MKPNQLSDNKVLDLYKMQGLPVDQLRRVLDKLYDGVPETTLYLTKIHAFYATKKNMRREHQVYMWMVRNGLTGANLVAFFTDQSGFLGGLNHIVNRIEGKKYYKSDIKIDEAY